MNTNLLNINYNPRTDAEMELVHVACILQDHMTWEPDFTFRAATVINDRDGWTYDAFLPSQRPYSPGSWTRVQDAHLSHEALLEAWDIAQAWLAQT